MSDHLTDPRVSHPSGGPTRCSRTAPLARCAALLGLTLAAGLPVAAAGAQEPRAPQAEAAGPPAPETQDAQGVEVARGVEARMGQAFAQLADSDADVREEARVRLMGLERRYLPALRKLVERSRPLLPSQAAVLRQIVTHVYLAGEPYDANANLGFLGVRMLDADVSLQVPDAVDPEIAPDEAEALLSAQKGVVITERMPGFVGNRMLLDGDVIIGLADRPEVRLEGLNEFSATVRRVGAGRAVRFVVLRRGRLIQVAITLDARPAAAEDQAGNLGPMTDLLSRRRQLADDYWDDAFAPLLKERVG